MRNDPAHEYTDRVIEEIQKQLRRLYRQAEKSIRADAIRYAETVNNHAEKLKESIDKAQTPRERRKAEQAYIRYFQQDIKKDKRYKALVAGIAATMYETNKKAADTINKRIAHVYATNYNDTGKGLAKSLSSYDFKKITDSEAERYGQLEQQTVNRRKDEAWNRKNVSSAVSSHAVTLKTAAKILAVAAIIVARRNRDGANRQASDMMTYAENQGRFDSMSRASDEGFPVKKRWIATLDNRTRDTHRYYDGIESVELDYEYAPGLKKPRDPACGDPAEVCNCRCRIVYDTGSGISPTRAARQGNVTGSYRDNRNFAGTYTYKVRNMSYEEWMRWRSI